MLCGWTSRSKREIVTRFCIVFFTQKKHSSSIIVVVVVVVVVGLSCFGVQNGMKTSKRHDETFLGTT